MKDKIVAITGATSGLGRATALQLAQKGASVVIIARSNTKANQVIKEIERKGGKGQSIISDLSSMKDAKEAAVSITYAVKRLDVLINNAGAHFPKYIETSEGFESTLALNYLSPFLLTHHLMEQMEQTASEYGEARIINISSVMHKGPINWDDLNYKDTTYSSTSAYYQSKHLLTSFTYYLSRQLKETGITVNCIHPGFVKTALAQSDYPFPMNIIVPIVGFFIGESPEQAADTPVWLALSNEVKGISGEYVHHRKAKKSWPPTRDENAQKRLYNVTQGMLSEWLTSRGRRRR
jgi:NAD(P)-dependent dehydrogenase (short-subunit alcohol dehydrogenase family)